MGRRGRAARAARDERAVAHVLGPAQVSGDVARRSAAPTSARSSAAASLKRRRTLRRLVLTTIWRPVSGSTIHTSPIAGSSS